MNAATYFPGINPVEILSHRASQFAIELGQKSSQFAVEQAPLIAAHPEISALAAIALFSVGAVAYRYFQGNEQVSSEVVEEVPQVEVTDTSDLEIVTPSSIQEVEEEEPVVESDTETAVRVFEEKGHRLTVRTSPGSYSYEYVGNGTAMPLHMAQIIQTTRSQFEQTSFDFDLFFPPIPYPVIVLNW